MYQVATSSNPPPNVDSLMPGQIYSPDEQCRQVYGPGSFLCQVLLLVWVTICDGIKVTHVLILGYHLIYHINTLKYPTPLFYFFKRTDEIKPPLIKQSHNHY